MWGCGPTDEGARLRTLRSEFNSLHPLHISLSSRGLKHDDASVLTKRSGLDSRREFQRVGSVTEQHGSVRSCKSGFDSRPAPHGPKSFLLLGIETQFLHTVHKFCDRITNNVDCWCRLFTKGPPQLIHQVDREIECRFGQSRGRYLNGGWHVT